MAASRRLETLVLVAAFLGMAAFRGVGPEKEDLTQRIGVVANVGEAGAAVEAGTQHTPLSTGTNLDAKAFNKGLEDTQNDKLPRAAKQPIQTGAWVLKPEVKHVQSDAATMDVSNLQSNVTGAANATVSHSETVLTPVWSWGSRIRNLGRHLFAGLSVAVMVKIACMVGNVVLQVSPMPQAQEWDSKGSTGNTDPAPYVSMCNGGAQWCSYGIAAWLITQNDGFLVLVYGNFLGAVLGGYYTSVFARHCSSESAGRSLRHYLYMVAMLVFAECLLWLRMPHHEALQIHSFIAGFCSFVTSCSLLTALPVVLRTGDTSGICGPLVWANFVGAFLWAYWGWLIADTVIIATNMCAAFSSAVCLYIKFVHQTSKMKQADNFPSGRMGDSWTAFSTVPHPCAGEEWEPLAAMK